MSYALPSYYRCRSCGHAFSSNNSFCQHFRYSNTCAREKPQRCLVHQDSSSSVPPANEFPVQQDHLSFLADLLPSPPSAFPDSTFQENEECDNSIFPNADEDYITGKNNESLEHSHAQSTSEFPSHDEFDSSYIDLACENILPIEQNPDFINLGACLELGEDSDSDLLYDSDNDDSIYGPSAAFSYGDDGMGASFFPGIQPPFLSDNARKILPSTLQPADEALLALVIENHLPQDMYNKILDWALFAIFMADGRVDLIGATK